MENKRKVILDVDTGSDDAIAIMVAVLSKQVDVLGITVTQGNRPLKNCVENTLRVLDMLDSHIPVYAGCPDAMVRNMIPGRNANNPTDGISLFENGVEYTIHPEYLELPPAVSKAQTKHACSFIIEAVKKSREKITIITVAPPTNIGMAFRMDPTIKDNIEEVIFMGGGVNVANVTPVAEANFFHDPEAVKIILDSGVKVKIIGLDATHSAEITMEEAEKLIGTGTKAGRLAGDLIKMRAIASKKKGWSDGTTEAIHDALAVATLLDPGVIMDMRRQKCDIDISGGAGDGQLIVDRKNQNNSSVNTYVAYKADKYKFYNIILECVKRSK
ncbi:nucleoside hydrolase [Hathewaya limosa]|uniref:Inosine-uridine nucleoside N-ribohydrolase n=1 Tax=Hathewaya limosa TaxID=1536 RepID=A0ABU0JSF0_HATLI|nr:nucleoside hydrolase [Hathewaya limosa]MDQ0480022.1 inosine-uridine nucleoside N-ribohydrolase [Hathewaya limosa]